MVVFEVKFVSKMVIYPKKVCFLHFSHLPASASEPNYINNLCSKSGLQNGKEFDQLQVSPRKISRKKPDPENPGKIRISNFCYFGSDFKNRYYKLSFYGVMKFFFAICTNSCIFDVMIFSFKSTKSGKFS